MQHHPAADINARASHITGTVRAKQDADLCDLFRLGNDDCLSVISAAELTVPL